MNTIRLGVCSWSLQADSPVELGERARAAGTSGLQLALDPLRTGAWSKVLTQSTLAQAGLEIHSGMMGTIGEDYSTLASIRATGGVRPDEHWEANRLAASANAALARELGLELISFHAGFLPEERGAERTKLLARLREIVDRFGEHGITAAFETGQERATILLEFLEELERPSAGVNFDPANMILYDMGDPVEALAALAERVRQIHVKDALPTTRKGAWGTEVPVGEGAVDWTRFFDVLAEKGLRVDLMIEREAGDQRVADISTARKLVERELAVRALVPEGRA